MQPKKMPQTQSAARGIASRTVLYLLVGRLLLALGGLAAGAGVTAEKLECIESVALRPLWRTFFARVSTELLKLRHVAFRHAHVRLKALLGAGVARVVPQLGSDGIPLER